MNKNSKNINTVIKILQNEVDGDVSAALEKMTINYVMTYMYKRGKKLFPAIKRNLKKELKAVYVIRKRKYEIKNIAEGRNAVMVEMIERYPDPVTKRIYCTPQVIVLEFNNGKIRTGRHYCDPAVSFLHLTKKQIAKAYLRSPTRKIIG